MSWRSKVIWVIIAVLPLYTIVLAVTTPVLFIFQAIILEPLLKKKQTTSYFPHILWGKMGKVKTGSFCLVAGSFNYTYIIINI